MNKRLILYFLCFSLAKITAQNAQPLFESLPASKTNIHFENKVFTKPGFNILHYFYHYNGGGVAIGDINNDGLLDVYLTANNKGGNKLYLNKGNFKFEDITQKARVAGKSDFCSGVTMADVNGDGLLDIYVSSVTKIYKLQGGNQLFINQGNNTFKDETKAYGLNVSGTIVQSAFFDYDHDGDLDCFILSMSLRKNFPIPMVNARYKTDTLFKSLLLKNNLSEGKKVFTDVTKEAGIYQSNISYGLGISVADINNDGWEDIYIGNDFYESDYYYINNKNGTFIEEGRKHFEHFSQFSMGNDMADINNDGQLDIITLDMLPKTEPLTKLSVNDDSPYTYKYMYIDKGYVYQYVKNCLQINNGNGSSFSEIAYLTETAATDWSWAPLFADFNNDGNKDLFITSGTPHTITDKDFAHFWDMQSAMRKKASDSLQEQIDAKAIANLPTTYSHPYFFKGNGNADFSDQSVNWGSAYLSACTSGAAYADLDNDGDLDLILNSTDSMALVLRNNSIRKNYISLSFKSKGLNTAAIGTKAYVYVNGKFQYQQLMPTRGFQSSVAPQLHFGLGNTNKVDSIVVVWTSQKSTTINKPKINKHHIINEQNSNELFNYEHYFPAKPLAYFNVTDSINCSWKHNENQIGDFYVQPLIPQGKSALGPKIAVADVNGDGLQDFYACNAANQSGTVMVQTPNGDFKPSNSFLFEVDKLAEDVDAQFFDADNDGDQDLYVVSGGNMYTGNNPFLLDRLYLNDGTGTFTKSAAALPKIYSDNSSVCIADVDNDGDQDVFVAGFTHAEHYGKSQSCYLLLNDGNGHFTESKQNATFKDLGMATDAAITDLNKDGLKDIVVVGEWMSITLFVNMNGQFTKTSIPQSTGLWQCILADDVNGDGNLDLLIGNWGLNTKLKAYKTAPLKMYVADVNKNGRVEQLLSFVENGIEYPFYSKEKTEMVLPFIKKKFLYYHQYANAPLDSIFGEMLHNVNPLTAERLASVVAYGDGKGGFTLHDLPKDLQRAPINTILKAKAQGSYLLGGNVYAVTPLENRYDAQALALMKYDGTQLIRSSQQNLSAIRGEVRDLKWIKSAKLDEVLMVIRNNQKLRFYQAY